jgi:hypothetical protein
MIVVIDMRDERRLAIVKLLAKLAGHENVHGFKHVGDCGAEIDSETIIFLHVGDDQVGARYAVEERYTNNRVVCYSGGKAVERDFTQHERKNPKHIWYKFVIAGNAKSAESHVRKNFAAFLDALKNNRADLSRVLNDHDPLPDAKKRLIKWINDGNSVASFKNGEDTKHMWALLENEDNQFCASQGFGAGELNEKCEAAAGGTGERAEALLALSRYLFNG